MFNVGDYVIYHTDGVCKVEDITKLDWVSNENKARTYYVLSPVKSPGSKIYSPVGNKKVAIRKVLTEKEAWELIDSIPDIPSLWITSEKSREENYKEAIRSCDSREWIQIIKTIYLRKRDRMANGKNITVTDDSYFKAAQSLLFTELATALERSEEGMESLIQNRLESSK